MTAPQVLAAALRCTPAVGCKVWLVDVAGVLGVPVAALAPVLAAANRTGEIDVCRIDLVQIDPVKAAASDVCVGPIEGCNAIRTA